MLVDTHCHLAMMFGDSGSKVLSTSKLSHIEQSRISNELSCIGKILQDAERVGVNKIINMGVDLASSCKSVELAARFPGVFAAVGIHPCDCSQDWQHDFKKIIVMAKDAKKNKIVAVGETGLDFYHKPFFKERQISAFKAHIELALELNLPVSVHIRKSIDEALCVLEEYKGDLRGSLHCFSHGLDIALQAIEWGLYLGVAGPVTYPKNDVLRDVVRDVPLESLLVETDAPFLPPQAYRGKQNSPVYIPLIAEEIARACGISVAEVCKATTENAERLFSLSISSV